MKRSAYSCAMLILLLCVFDHASLHAMNDEDDGYHISDNAPYLRNTLFLGEEQLLDRAQAESTTSQESPANISITHSESLTTPLHIIPAPIHTPAPPFLPIILHQHLAQATNTPPPTAQKGTKRARLGTDNPGDEDPDEDDANSDNVNNTYTQKKSKNKKQAGGTLPKKITCTQEVLERFVTQGYRKFAEFGLDFTRAQKLAQIIEPACGKTYAGSKSLANHIKGTHMGLSRNRPGRETKEKKLRSSKHIKKESSIVDIWRERAAAVNNHAESNSEPDDDLKTINALTRQLDQSKKQLG